MRLDGEHVDGDAETSGEIKILSKKEKEKLKKARAKERKKAETAEHAANGTAVANGAGASSAPSKATKAAKTTAAKSGKAAALLAKTKRAEATKRDEKVRARATFDASVSDVRRVRLDARGFDVCFDFFPRAFRGASRPLSNASFDSARRLVASRDFLAISSRRRVTRANLRISRLTSVSQALAAERRAACLEAAQRRTAAVVGASHGGAFGGSGGSIAGGSGGA